MQVQAQGRKGPIDRNIENGDRVRVEQERLTPEPVNPAFLGLHGHGESHRSAPQIEESSTYRALDRHVSFWTPRPVLSCSQPGHRSPTRRWLLHLITARV